MSGMHHYVLFVLSVMQALIHIIIVICNASIKTVFNPQCACAAGVTVVVLCVCLSVCLSAQGILAIRAIKSIMKDTIVTNIRFTAIQNAQDS